ncbi:hypothetical protein BDN70DRAFT_25518 [Pholiota conissans]|uniref:F-box domain-containing protein n=1 Tax=Pholiota conissans TaxID=109636 RepID=A0A9P5ZD14_9AGAR|nr:hypothetical protein BDN70DRAFT_25518 [Pholiota conissans]
MERFMNVDVVAQVAQWLEPRDLLRFAVINKTTWNFFLRMKAIWRKSRKDFSLRNQMVCQLPECPPDLTEIQYTSMIFGPPSKCSVKLCRSDKTTVFLEARLQLCNECLVNTYEQPL